MKRTFQKSGSPVALCVEKALKGLKIQENFPLHFLSGLRILKTSSGEKWWTISAKWFIDPQRDREWSVSRLFRKKGEAGFALFLPSSPSFLRRGGQAAVTGQYQHTIDAKGRLFIPAKLREELGETFYVTMGADPCLSVYSDASWARFTEKFESLPYSKTKAMRPLFANAAKCEPDAQGRILLPQKLRAYAGLEKDVVVIGVSNRAEIWNADKWAALEAEELNPENIAAVMEELGF